MAAEKAGLRTTDRSTYFGGTAAATQEQQRRRRHVDPTPSPPLPQPCEGNSIIIGEPARNQEENSEQVIIPYSTCILYAIMLEILSPPESDHSINIIKHS